MIRGAALLLLSGGLFPATALGPVAFGALVVAGLSVAASWAAADEERSL